MQKTISVNNTVQRRIEYLELKYSKDGAHNIILTLSDIKKLFELIRNNIKNIFVNDQKKNKWCGIENIVIENDYIEVILKNCNYAYSPDVINVSTLIERSSDKDLDEGDKEKTHVLIKKDYILYEKKRNGCSHTNFKKLINMFLSSSTDKYFIKNSSVELSVIMVNDFMDKFKTSKRIKKINVSYNLQKSTDEFANFSLEEGISNIYTKTYSAVRKGSISRNRVFDILNQKAKKKDIEKITIDIVDEDDENMVINTDEYARNSIINVNKKSNGEVDTKDIFSKMLEL